MRTVLKALLAAVAMIPGMALAQEGPQREQHQGGHQGWRHDAGQRPPGPGQRPDQRPGGDRPRGWEPQPVSVPQAGGQPPRPAAPMPPPQSQPQPGGWNEPGRPGRTWPRNDGPGRSSPIAGQPGSGWNQPGRPAPGQPGGWNQPGRPDRPDRTWPRNDGPGRSSPVAGQPGGGWNDGRDPRSGGRPDRGPAGGWNGNDDRGDDRSGRGGWNRPSQGWRQGQRNDQDWRDMYRDEDRFGERGNWSNNAWSRNWRNDRRYDWGSYRVQNRQLYHLPRYYAPYGWDGGYRRFSIGVRLTSGLWGENYWIDEPDYYRLPPAYGPYRWVRYYNDAVLVDIRNGLVVDVIYDIFW